jgi:hypothetical protein
LLYFINFRGNSLLNVIQEHRHYPNPIFIPWTSRFGKTTDQTFISGPADSNCGNIVNKWLCIFLPSTNCTVPDNLRSVSPADEKNRLYIDNKLLTESEALTFRSQWKAKPSFDYSFNYFYDCIRMKSKHYDNMITTDTTEVWKDSVDFHHQSINLLFGILTKFNLNFLDVIQKRMIDIRLSKNLIFQPNKTCVAIHIRMDDRSIVVVVVVVVSKCNYYITNNESIYLTFPQISERS